MKTILPLKNMSRLEKIQAMEEIWQDLSASEEEIESPVWHQNELEKREKRIQAGEESYISWEEAKQRLRNG